MLDLSAVLEKWSRSRTVAFPPSDRDTVIATLAKTGRKFSEDVVDLYCATGGMKDDEADEHCWTLWSLDRVVKENSFLPGPDLYFADFLISSHFYCFRFEAENRSSVYADFGR